MNITADITMGMLPHEKEIYFAHMEKRHREEQIKINEQREINIRYKHKLIDEIIIKRPDLTREYLAKLSLRHLENIAY